MILNRWSTALVAVLSLIVSEHAFAAVPQTIGYQGRLYDASNQPINTSVSVVFAIYSAASGGSPVWTETQTVTFTNGYFSAQLGAVTPFVAGTTFNGTVRFLGVTVGADAEMTPRSQIASVPYALSAGPDSRFGTNTSMAKSNNPSLQTARLCTIGEVLLFAGNVAGATPAQGQLLQISGNTVLFAILGSAYGGDGTTTFALPDLRGAAPNGLTYGICTDGLFPAN